MNKPSVHQPADELNINNYYDILSALLGFPLVLFGFTNMGTKVNTKK